jgi:DNA-binding response OmpR family regulator
MVDELVSLPIIVVSGSRDIQEMLRQAASAPSVPIETLEAGNAAAAARSLSGGADLVFVDGDLSSEEIAQVVAAACQAAKPPFTVLLAKPDTGAVPFKTDALATKPAQLEEARRLMEAAAADPRARGRRFVDDALHRPQDACSDTLST